MGPVQERLMVVGMSLGLFFKTTARIRGIPRGPRGGNGTVDRR